MKRRAKNLFCLFSLLIFAGSITLWVRSYRGVDCLIHATIEMDPARPRMAARSVYYSLDSWRGRIDIRRLHEELPQPVTFNPGWSYGEGDPLFAPNGGPRPMLEIHHHFAGFEFSYYAEAWQPGWFSDLTLDLPFWIFLPSAIPPFLWWRKRRKVQRRGFPVEVTGSTVVST